MLKNLTFAKNSIIFVSVFGMAIEQMSSITNTKRNNMEKNKQIAKQNGKRSLGAITFNNLDELRKFGEEIIKSGLVPQKNGGEAIATILYGQELGLDAMVSLNNIVSINGRCTLGIHLISALLQKAGVVVELVKDYEPCAAFVLKGEDGNPKLSNPADSKSVTLLRVDYFDAELKDYECRSKSVVDYKTTVKMTRNLKQPDGKYEKSTITRSFSRNDAIIAGLIDENKPLSAWNKYSKVQCYNRAVAICGRAIAADILLGTYETSEVADVAGISYTVEENHVILETVVHNAKEQTNGNIGEEVTPIETDTHITS